MFCGRPSKAFQTSADADLLHKQWERRLIVFFDHKVHNVHINIQSRVEYKELSVKQKVLWREESQLLILESTEK